jgi:F-type H+-transporting ATPase subunit b
MNINLTLIGQSISFAFFVWFCMKFVWPPIMKALDERKQTIADGLASAEKGKHEEELAKKRATDVLHEAKGQAAEIIARAEKRAAEVVEEAKGDAKVEADRVLASAQAQLDQELNRAREQLREQIGALAVSGAEQILKREVDAKAHAKLLEELATQL